MVTRKYEENMAVLQAQVSAYQECLKVLRNDIITLAESRKQHFVLNLTTQIDEHI